MARRRNPPALLAAVFVASAAAQSTTATPSSATSPASSSTTASTSNDIPLSLWGVANSLLTSYYPSTSLGDVGTLTWPANVVIDGTTYHVHSGSGITTATLSSTEAASTTPATASASPTAGTGNETEASKAQHDQIGDRRLGIILGCVLGFVALAMMGLLFWCLWRRKESTGSFFQGRRTPSATSSQMRSWIPRRQDTFGTTSYVSAGPPSPTWDEKTGRMSVMPVRKPPMSQHPAYMRPVSESRSTSEENPFYTPAERMDRELGHDIEANQFEPAPAHSDSPYQTQRTSFESFKRGDDRPPTPFSPMAMMGFGSKPQQAEQDQRVDLQLHTQQPHHNPFTSPEDDEADDVISPILPTRSPERRYSPIVHYPSWDEVNSFDFHGNGKQPLRDMSSNEDGGDGWRPPRGERTDGRHELA